MQNGSVTLRLEAITKRFGNFVANDAIDLNVAAGEVHGLLGENGAGKTTLMNILCGLYRPDAGQIYLRDRPVQISSPSTAIAHGIGTIHQHFMLVPQLTVTENIILGTTLDWRLDLQRKAREIAALADRYRFSIDPSATVGDLPVGTQQRVEILKALYRRAKLLILDEPTAVLTPPEIQGFFTVLRQLAATGHTILFISHKLDEVLGLCDGVTVLRRGKVVGSALAQDCTQQRLARLMVGRDVSFHPDKPPRSPNARVLEVQQLQVKDDRQLAAVRDLSFHLEAGEILGIVGVDGNGQRELADAIVGLRPVSGGKIRLSGREITHWTAQQRVKQLKIGYIPEDRQQMGLILRFTIARNLILKTVGRLPFCRHGLLQERAISQYTTAALQAFDIRASSGNLRVSQLSGGNQQKVVLARELSGNPDLIVAMQPTRGLDVGATESVQQALLAERQRGAAILYISTELEELMKIADRIAVLYEGRIVDILDATTATIDRVGALMTGGTQ
jgi:general nucleoside transport system ATP-binding protein